MLLQDNVRFSDEVTKNSRGIIESLPKPECQSLWKHMSLLIQGILLLGGS